MNDIDKCTANVINNLHINSKLSTIAFISDLHFDFVKGKCLTPDEAYSCLKGIYLLPETKLID